MSTTVRRLGSRYSIDVAQSSEYGDIHWVGWPDQRLDMSEKGIRELYSQIGAALGELGAAPKAKDVTPACSACGEMMSVSFDASYVQDDKLLSSWERDEVLLRCDNRECDRCGLVEIIKKDGYEARLAEVVRQTTL